MSDLLPERPDLDQLRRRAKELRDAARGGQLEARERVARHHPLGDRGEITLAVAQLVIARELGFSSWPVLKLAVDAEATRRGNDRAFVSASIDRDPGEAVALLAANPNIGRLSICAAAVLGDAPVVREMLAADSASAVSMDEERGWPPLLYACYSKWHQLDPRRSAGIAEVVRLLLDGGGNPNTNDGGNPRFRSALKGAVEVDNPAVVEVLLEAGAIPDMGQPIGEAASNGGHRCLQLLLSFGARIAGTWAVGGAVFADDPVALRLLLEAVRVRGDETADLASEALSDAATQASAPVVVALLEAGADPNATDESGISPFRRAVRAGKEETATALRNFGASDDAIPVDLFLGACLRGDRSGAESLLVEHPGLQERLTEQDLNVIVDAAASCPAETLAILLDFGFSPDARNELGEQPLHSAAYQGNAGVVRLLLGAGADVNGRDGRFDATPLAFATVGSGEQRGKPGDWVLTVRLLIGAGASREDVWITEKPPSEEVKEVLRRYGIRPDVPANEPPVGGSHEIAPLGTGVMADVARHIEAAYRDTDLDLLGSLLHPQVRWTGLCNTSAEVLDWYRGFLTEGIRPIVQSVEVDGEAVILGVQVVRPAQGARPAPPQQLYQVFTVRDAQVVEIRGYPDRVSAGAAVS